MKKNGFRYGYQSDINRIEHWLKSNKVAPTTLGLALGGGVGLTERVLRGKCTIKTLRKVLHHVTRYPKVKDQYKAR